ncbi:MAG: hypothetical protein EBT21_06415, partial [Actinobacteria bacterium]|nr:hypothetical protein [Actinomycetota bacterium]
MRPVVSNSGNLRVERSSVGTYGVGVNLPSPRTKPDRIEIQGVDALHGATHRIMPDRIEAGTFAAAAAVVGGTVNVDGVEPTHMKAFIDLLDHLGV